MTCLRCGGTGWALEWEEIAGPGYVDIECPQCHGVDGEEPDIVTEAGDVLTELDKSKESC